MKARVSDPRWVWRAHVARGIKKRYRTGLAALTAALKLTANHPDASRLQADAMDLIGACEDWRWWRPERDLGVKYRAQVQAVGHARNKVRLANALRIVAQDLQRYRLALGLRTRNALTQAGLRPDARRVRALAKEDYNSAAVFDFWYFEVPLYASMLASALRKLSKSIRDPPNQVEFKRGLAKPASLRIGYILMGGSQFPIPQMPRVALAVNLVQLLARISDHTAGPQSHAEYRKDLSSRQSIPGAHFKVAAAFVSDALEIDYSPAAAAKAIQKFRSRHPNFMLMNWPYQPPAEEDEFVQSLR